MTTTVITAQSRRGAPAQLTPNGLGALLTAHLDLGRLAVEEPKVHDRHADADHDAQRGERRRDENGHGEAHDPNDDG